MLIPSTDDKVKEIMNWVLSKSKGNVDEAQDYNYGERNWVTDTYSEGLRTDYKDLGLNRTGIFGMPYQFNSSADVPIGSIYNDGNKYIGRVFEEHVFANMPLVFFEIGKPLFMDNLNKDKSTTSWVLQSLDRAVELGSGFTMDGLSLEKNGNWLFNSTNQLRYYGFKDDFLNYSHYVNSMARFLAIKMGIGSEKCTMTGQSKLYRDFDIKQIKNRYIISTLLTTLTDTATSYHIPLFCNATATSVSENGSNTTGDSMLATAVKSGSQLAKEIGFLLNTTAPEISDSALSGITTTLENLTGNLSTDGVAGFLKKLGNMGTTIVNGANMMFPAIWQDSSYTKSYSISARFATPYGDPISIFNDVYVPFLCILAMALPRQQGSSGYGSPFIVKAHSKGYFNCDMGIIESIDVKRGGPEGNEWTYDGLPNEIEVTFTIKDLYPAMVATQAKATSFMFAGNSGLIDYLNMMAGLNLVTIDPLSNIYAGMSMIGSSIYNWSTELGYNINYAIYRSIKQVTDGFFS